MSERKKRCKYCDVAIKYGTTCYHCSEKLILVRRIQKMVRNAKEDVERRKRYASKT